MNKLNARKIGRNDLSRLGTPYPTHHLYLPFVQKLIRFRKNRPVNKSNALGIIAFLPAYQTENTVPVCCAETQRTRVKREEEFICCSIDAQIISMELLFSQYDSHYFSVLNRILPTHNLAHPEGNELSALKLGNRRTKRCARLLFNIFTGQLNREPHFVSVDTVGTASIYQTIKPGRIVYRYQALRHTQVSLRLHVVALLPENF